MTINNKHVVDAAVDDLITRFAQVFEFTLEQAVTAILESSTVANFLASTTISVGLVKQDKTDPVKARQLANVAASDESIAKLSRTDFVAKLLADLHHLAVSTDLDEAAKKYSMVQWLCDLPANDKANDVGLEYTDAMMRTMFFRFQKKVEELLGSVAPEFKSSYEHLLTDTRKEVDKSVEKRLKTVDSAVVESEASEMMANFTARCKITPNTEWVIALYSKNIPVSLCVDFLIAMFIYSVDLKWCDATDMAEFTANFKTQRVKPTKPANPRVHGYNRAPWAVANWINRIKGDGSTLLPHEQGLLTRTLQLMQPFIHMLDRALDCLPAVGMRAVFRGVPVRLSHQFGIDDEFVMEPHTSTSLEGEEALTFMDPKKPGTFFILRLHSAGMIDFMSAYPHQAEALLAMHSSFRVANKLSRTVLRMLGCRFDVITLAEGGCKATDSELIEFLCRSAKQTSFIFREYLESMISIRLFTPREPGASKTNDVMLLDSVHELVRTVGSKNSGSENTKKKHVLITGDAGCGKTSATLSAFSHLVQQDGCYAALIPLPSVKNFGTEGDVDTVLLEALDISADCFSTLCEKYSVFVILDSLDEVGQLSTRLVEQGILPRNKLLAQAASVIVSCRTEVLETFNIKNMHAPVVGPSPLNDNGESVATWSIAPFSDEDSLEMVRRRAMMSDGTVSEAALLRHVDCAPKELQTHPLYLKMILRIPIGSLNSGATRLDVYKHFIDCLVADVVRDDDGEEQRQLEMLERLQNLALHEMLLNEQWQVTVGTAKQVLGCTGDDLELLPFRVDDPHDSGSQLGFLHRSQAEYLAAMALAQMPNEIKHVTDRLSATAKRGTLNFIVECDHEKAQAAAISELLLSCGEGASLIPKLEKDLQCKEAEHGSESVALAFTLKSLGLAYRAKGENRKSLEATERALQLQEKHYGPDHVELAVTLKDLGIAYGDKSDHVKELELQQRAVLLQEAHYGPDHIELAKTLMNLGVAYRGTGNKAKFLEHLERALQLQEKHLGPNHIDLAKTLINLGIAHGDKGNDVKKLEFMERALQLQENHYGPEHVELANALKNLGLVYAEQGDKAKDLELQERALQLQEKQYGSHHIKLARTLTDLGIAYGANGNNSKKEHLIERALALQEKHHGPDHIVLAKTLIHLGVTKGVAGDHTKKLELLGRALGLQEKHHGPDHIELAITLMNLSVACGATGDDAKKLALMERALQLQKDHYGADHINLANTLMNLAASHKKEEYAERQELIERALSLQEKHHGPEHIELAKTLLSLAAAYSDEGIHEKALETTERALSLSEKHLGRHHSTTLKRVKKNGLVCAKAANRPDKVAEFKKWIAK